MSNPSPTAAPSRPGPWRRLARRALPLAVLALGVLGLHGLLLAGWPAGVAAQATPASPVFSVRQIVRTPEPVPEPVPVPMSVPPPEPTRAVAAAAPAPPPRRPVAPAALSAAEPAAEPAAAPAAVAATPATAEVSAPMPPAAAEDEAPRRLAAAPAAAAASALEADPPPPTYRTRVPPSTVLQYELRRGALSGEGELRWQRGADAYELSIEGTVLGLQVLSQASRGGFDLAGLAPQRFVDRRRGRDQRAANFQRDRGLITYSGSPAQYPLVAGAQDRLSWMLQLAAIVDADPARWRAGASIQMAVSGSRGDTDVWSFNVVGREAVDLVGARLEAALVLRREPRKPFDTRVDVWLDPDRHHLPVRLRLRNGQGAEALEFVLRP